MRRIPALFVLAIVAAISIGCSKSDQGSAPNANAAGTTTYSNSTSAPSGTGGGATTTAPKSSQSNSNSPGEPKIKPPTDK